MNKALALSATGVGASSVVIGGHYLAGNFGKGSTSVESSQDEAKDAKLSNELSFKTLEEFKTGKGGECGKHAFGDNLTLGTEGTAIDTNTHKIEDNHFSSGADSKGCLVINWEKTSSSENSGKWKGDFRWVWAFASDSKGFIMFTTTKLSSTDKQLDLEGGIYFVKKGNSNDGTVDKYSTLSGKNITSSNGSEMFLQQSGDSSNSQIKGFGGFMTAATDLDNVCKEADKDNCVTGNTQTTKNFKGSWTGIKGENGTEKLTKGCSNLENCFSKMYEAQAINLPKLLESFSGTWKEEQVTQSPSTT